MNTDRDPIDPSTLGAAVSTWLASDPHDQAADQALIATMLAQGVLTPEEASEAWTDESADRPVAQVYVLNPGGVSIIVVDEAGEVQARRI